MFGMKRGGTYVIVGLIGGQTTVQIPMIALGARTIRGVSLEASKKWVS